MRMESAPGYKQLFGQTVKTYEEWLTDIHSEIVIIFAIMMNNEINLPEEQRRRSVITELLNAEFTNVQRATLRHAFRLYSGDNQANNKSFFARRYLLAMLLKEFKRNKLNGDFSITPDQRFSIIMAYFQVIDDEHEADKKLLDIFSITKDTLTEYRMLWCSTIEQFEFNQDANAVFELIKLFCFCKYSYDNLRPYLKEYLAKYGFRNIRHFIDSFSQLANTTLLYHKDDWLTSLSFIDPLSAVNKEHLKSLSINHLLGKDILGLVHLRKFPIYETLRKRFYGYRPGYLPQKTIQGTLL